MASSSGLNENWFLPFSKLNLQNKITGDCVIDWSDDHNIAVTTSRKIVICNNSQLGRSADFEYDITALPLPVSDDKKESLEKMKEYDSLCQQSSNVAAYPDFDIYQVSAEKSLFPSIHVYIYRYIYVFLTLGNHLGFA